MNSPTPRLHRISDWLVILEQLDSIPPRYKKHFMKLLKIAAGGAEFDEDKNVALIRCPGRYSDYGNHIDYKACGGPVYGTATEEAIYGLFQIRADGNVRLLNTDAAFSPKEFSLSEVESGHSFVNHWNDWDRWTAEQYQQLGSDCYSSESWDKYIRGLLLLLTELPAVRTGTTDGSLPGFTALYSSDLSFRGGKSSSSALVLNTALGLDALFEFRKPDVDTWIDLIGLSEWYVMTRGGCADHARMLYSKKGQFVLVGSFPTRLIAEAPIPSGLLRVIVHSGIDRPQDPPTLNEMRVSAAGYTLAMLYIKQLFPQFREPLEEQDPFYGVGNLREFTSIGRLNLRISPTLLCSQILRRLPMSVNPDQIRHALPDFREQIETLFANHTEPQEGYFVRDFAIFGLAEIERTLGFLRACQQGNLGEILRLIRLSQDGDRVSRSIMTRGRWETVPYSHRTSDQMLNHMAQELKANPRSAQGQILNLPGRFGRSTQYMDQLADLVTHHFPHDAAIRIMGAGKGGDMQAVVRDGRLEEFLDVIKREYFRKIARIDDPQITVLRGSAEGARVLEVDASP